MTSSIFLNKHPPPPAPLPVTVTGPGQFPTAAPPAMSCHPPPLLLPVRLRFMPRFARFTFLSLCAGLVLSPSLRLAGDPLILPPTADRYIRASQSAAQTANSTNSILLAGNTATEDDILRGVLAFDLSSPPLEGATIHEASLVLTVSERDTAAGGSADAGRSVQLLALDGMRSEEHTSELQ